MESKRNFILRNRTYFLYILLLLLFSSLQASERETEIRQIKELFYRFNFDSAFARLDSLQDTQPDEPAWWFYEGYLQMIVFTQDMTNDTLLREMKLNFKRCISLIKKNPDFEKSPELNYYLGLSNGAIGVYYVVDKNYFKGFLYGRRAKKRLEKTIQLNKNYYDAYLGLGIYHYYVGIMPGILRFLAGIVGFSGNKEQGLKEIMLASKKGQNFKTEAILTISLINYFFRNRQYKPLLNLKKLAQKYPDNPAFQLIIGYHYRRTLRPQIALSYFIRVDDAFFDRLPQIFYMKYYNMMVCYYRLQNFTEMIRAYQILDAKSSRMTMYYQSALHYYRAMLAIIQRNEPEAMKHLQQIPNKSHTKYWYLSAQIFLQNELKTYLPDILIYENMVLAGHYHSPEIDHLEKKLMSQMKGEQTVWVLQFFDWRGVKFFFNGNYEAASNQFNYILNFEGVYKGTDYFFAWVHLHYARSLIHQNQYNLAKKHLDFAAHKGDDYMKLILEREREKIKKGEKS